MIKPLRRKPQDRAGARRPRRPCTHAAAELDWMEIAVPDVQRGRAALRGRALMHHLEILALRQADWNARAARSDREPRLLRRPQDDCQPLQALGADLHARIAAIAGAASGPPADARAALRLARPPVAALLRVTDPDWLTLIVERRR
jgi:hypothetical protein